jgi:predicted transcriptional regulator
MEIHQVRYFLAVCERLSFTQAARQCHVTQPSLTRAIQHLEKTRAGGITGRMRQAADGIREVVDGFDAEAVGRHDARRQGSNGVTETL